jgi:hypothetical protein
MYGPVPFGRARMRWFSMSFSRLAVSWIANELNAIFDRNATSG